MQSNEERKNEKRQNMRKCVEMKKSDESPLIPDDEVNTKLIDMVAIGHEGTEH